MLCHLNLRLVVTLHHDMRKKMSLDNYSKLCKCHHHQDKILTTQSGTENVTSGAVNEFATKRRRRQCVVKSLNKRREMNHLSHF